MNAANDLSVNYVKGKVLHIADTLCGVHQSDFTQMKRTVRNLNWLHMFTQ